MNINIPLDQPALSQAAMSAATVASSRPRPYHKFDSSVKVEVVRVNGKRLSSGETAPVAVGRRNLQGKPVRTQRAANKERPRKYARISDPVENVPLSENGLDCGQLLDRKYTEAPPPDPVPSSDAVPAPWMIDDAEAPAPTAPLIARRSRSSNIPDVLLAGDIAEIMQTQPAVQETERRATEIQCNFPLQPPMVKEILADLQLKSPVSPIGLHDSPVSVATQIQHQLGSPPALANGQSTWGRSKIGPPKPCAITWPEFDATWPELDATWPELEATWPELEAAISPMSCAGASSKDVWKAEDSHTRGEDILQEQPNVISTEGPTNATDWSIGIDDELMADQSAMMESLAHDMEPFDCEEGNKIDMNSLTGASFHFENENVFLT